MPACLLLACHVYKQGKVPDGRPMQVSYQYPSPPFYDKEVAVLFFI